MSASSATQSSIRAADANWIVPFFLVLVGALTFFFWQVAQYTTLLG